VEKLYTLMSLYDGQLCCVYKVLSYFKLFFLNEIFKLRCYGSKISSSGIVQDLTSII
jgi:hypothetical protein